MKQIKLRGDANAFALVDDEDYPILSRFKWRCATPPRSLTNYATMQMPIGDKQCTISMHRLIMGSVTAGWEIDHVDGNGLNNQKSNLRIVTHSFNMTAAMLRQGKDGRIAYKSVRKWLSDGRLAVYYYHRSTGMRLPGCPGDPDFEMARRTLGGVGQTQPGQP